MIHRYIKENDENEFQTIFRPSIEINTMPWKSVNGPEHIAAAELKYDSENFYIRMRAYEKSSSLLSHRQQFGDPVCRDSCLEFFFAPIAGSNKYFNFEVNPACAFYIGFSEDGTRNGNRLLSELVSETDCFQASTRIKKAFWEVYYRIPFSFIRRYAPDFKTPGKGDVLRCNFYTCCDDAPEPYYSVWHNITSPHPDYHRPDCFGSLIFE